MEGRNLCMSESRKLPERPDKLSSDVTTQSVPFLLSALSRLLALSPPLLHPLPPRKVRVGLIYRNLGARCLRGNPLRTLFPCLSLSLSLLIFASATHGPSDSGEIPRWSPVQNGRSIIRDPREPRSCPSRAAQSWNRAKKHEERTPGNEDRGHFRHALVRVDAFYHGA